MYLQCKYRLSCARAAAFATVSARYGCLRGRGFSSADAAELRQPLWSGKHGGKEARNAQVEVKTPPVQAAAPAKDLDCTDIAGRNSPETGDELHEQGDRCTVSEFDPQGLLAGAILDLGGPWLNARGALPAAGRPSEIRTRLLLHPARH